MVWLNFPGESCRIGSVFGKKASLPDPYDVSSFFLEQVCMIHQLRSRRLAWDRYDLIALALILLMVAVRLSLSILGFPGTDSEEGTMGLMALHIAQGKDWPIFYYGQNYMGAGEAYVGALMFHLFGVSLLSLRLGMVLFLVVFMVGIYRLASLLYGKKVALVSLFLLSIGARFVITPEMRAVGGAVETLVFGTLSLLLASWLAITSLGLRPGTLEPMAGHPLSFCQFPAIGFLWLAGMGALASALLPASGSTRWCISTHRLQPACAAWGGLNPYIHH